METVKKTDEYTVFKKGNGRYAVRGSGRKFINGADKVKILLELGLIKVSAPNPEAAVEEAPAEEAEAAEETAAEEATEEETKED